ncbi:MAG: hypothetical protein ACPHCJ_11525, partial [Oceanococcaceae bacterium]
AAIGPELDPARAAEVREAQGQWLLPGLLDIHTHLDLEVELDPRLPEVLRHGTTTVVMSNCSLGLAFGAQLRNGENPIVDCFARVENVPKSVLQKVVDQVDWQDSAGYLSHLATLPLGPNVVPMIPHSMLRAEVMGLAGSVARAPNAQELQQMEALLEQGMRQGYVGFSTDALPFHYLANDPHRRVKIPTQFASFAELKRLTNVVRAHDRVWQATPPKDSRLQTLRQFLLTSGRLFGKPLKITAVAALDVVSNRSIGRMAIVLTRLLNSALLRGRFRLQALAAPFRVYADGMLTPLAEETPALRELNEPDLEDRAARMALLNDAAYVQRFRKAWYQDKRGFGLDRLKRALGLMDDTLRRDLADMRMTAQPVPAWDGQTLEQVYGRYQAWVAGASAQPEDVPVFEALGPDLGDDCDFFLGLLKHFDTDLRWSVLAANDRPEVVQKLLFDEQILPGFNDSGAHLSNMAFYDANLRGLQLAQKQGLDQVARHVRRLSAEPADFFGIDAGRIAIGRRADLLLLDPTALAAYDSEAGTRLQHREAFGHVQMVNRSDGVVAGVYISGQLAWDGQDFTAVLGQQALGAPLLAGVAAPTPAQLS